MPCNQTRKLISRMSDAALAKMQTRLLTCYHSVRRTGSKAGMQRLLNVIEAIEAERRKRKK